MKSLCLALLIFSASFAGAAPAPHKGIAVQAYILTPAQVPASGSGLTVTSQILTPGDCILIEEQFTGVSVSNGYLRLNVGTGTRTGADKGLSLAEALDNVKSRLGLDGPSAPTLCNYSPTSQDARKVRVSFNLGADAITANFALRSTGYAVASDDAQALQGKSASEFIQPNVSKSATQSMFENFFAASVLNLNKPIQFNGTGFVGMDPVVNGGNIAQSTIQSASIISLPYSKLTDIPGGLSQIAGLSCADGKILKLSGGAIVCGDQAPGNAGTVTSVTAGDGLIGATITSSGSLAVDYTKVVSTLDSKYLNAIQSTAAPGGDLSNLWSSPVVSKIRGTAVSATTPIAGQSLKMVGSQYVPSYINISDIRSSVSGAAVFPASCAANQTLVYQSGSDTFGCANVSVSATQLPAFTGDVTSSAGSSVLNLSTSVQSAINSIASKEPAIPTGVKTQYVGGDKKLYALDKAAVGLDLVTNTPDGLKPISADQQAALDLKATLTANITGGDLRGTYAAPTVTKIQGTPVSATAPATGQILKYSSTGTAYTPSYVNLSDIRSGFGTGIGGPVFPSSCTSGQAISYQSATDTFACLDVGGSVRMDQLRAPTITKLTSGTNQSYTVPPGVTQLKIRMVGGGGGGGGASGGGGTGGDTTFSTFLTANGGGGGAATSGVVGGTGGSYTLSAPAIGSGFAGSDGTSGTPQLTTNGGDGGVSFFGGAGRGGIANNGSGSAARANSGSGGGGGAGNNVTGSGGGAAGGYIEAQLSGLAASYNYTVGAAGSGGSANGGAGAAGYIEITEIYGWNLPTVIGGVSSPSTTGTEKVVRIKLNSDCAIVSQSGVWANLASGTSMGTICKYTFATGIFSAAPTCVVSTNEENTGAVFNPAVSATGFGIHTRALSPSSADYPTPVSVICMGPQ